MLNKLIISFLIIPYSLFGCSKCLDKVRCLIDEYSIRIIRLECSDYKELEIAYLLGKLEAYNESMHIIEDCSNKDIFH